MDFLVGLLAILLLWPLLKWWISWRYFVTTIDKIPGPQKHLLLGTLHKVGMKRNEIYKKVTVQGPERKSSEGIKRSWMAHIAIVRLTKPEYVEKVLLSTKNITKGISYEMAMKQCLGNGLLTGSGEQWKVHRKIITKTFHFSILSEFVEVFAEKFAEMVQDLDKFCDTDEIVDASAMLKVTLLDIICETAMGIKVKSFKKEINNYIEAVETMCECGFKQLLNPLFHNKFIFSLTPLGRKCRKTIDRVHSFTNSVIAERKKLRKLNELEGGQGETVQKSRVAFLDLLLVEMEHRPYFSDKDIREEVDTFVLAGYDTTAVTFGWALFLLGHHPEVQEKLFEEQKNIFGDSKAPPTQEELGDMKYMECVMKESIRVYPSVLNIMRRVTDEFEVGGYTIPVGTMLSLSLYACSRDEESFPEPEKFDPDRWLPENCKDRHPFAHIPFSAGPRNCIGQKYAQLEEKVFLSMMIRNFKFMSVDSRKEIKIIPEVVARPSPGIRLRLKRRV